MSQLVLHFMSVRTIGLTSNLQVNTQQKAESPGINYILVDIILNRVYVLLDMIQYKAG